jgi:uncharacterized protein YecE (DUF72 family)
MAEIWIGCSGFSYKHWKKVFYPEDMPEKKWLQFYSSVFATVELNVTFYHLPSQAAFASWHRDTPPGFGFAVKGSRYITHVKRLVDPREALAKFFEAASLLEEKIKVVLWQFPPQYKINLDRLSSFLGLLKQYPLRHVFEFRHESWIVPSLFDLCREHNAGLCMADSPEFIDDLPVTADFVYIRRHGHGARYAGRYSKAQLEKDASRIRKHHDAGRDVFIYFNNDAHGYAPLNAGELGNIMSSLPLHLKN